MVDLNTQEKIITNDEVQIISIYEKNNDLEHINRLMADSKDYYK